jgi:hypothetical protein
MGRTYSTNGRYLPYKKITLDKPEGRRRVGRPNLRWMDGVMGDAERLGVRNWRSKAKDRDGWRQLLESAKTLHGLYSLGVSVQAGVSSQIFTISLSHTHTHLVIKNIQLS